MTDEFREQAESVTDGDLADITPDGVPDHLPDALPAGQTHNPSANANSVGGGQNAATDGGQTDE